MAKNQAFGHPRGYNHHNITSPSRGRQTGVRVIPAFSWQPSRYVSEKAWRPFQAVHVDCLERARHDFFSKQGQDDPVGITYVDAACVYEVSYTYACESFSDAF
jgi:hypothetical protein